MRSIHAHVGALAFAVLSILSPMRVPALAAAGPLQIVLVEPDTVTAERCAVWKREGFGAVALVLDERHGAATLQRAAATAASNSLGLYHWVEVGRCPALAHEHPEWMASLGMHGDWRNRYPKTTPPKKGEVAKAWPWVPISYTETFDAQLARVGRLLERAPEGVRGVLLNDLQAGPSACGCGNLQCRWAVDYGVPSTATKLPGNDVAARFVAELAKASPDRKFIPVWVTECENEDLPAGHRPPDSWGTGYCGDVQCFDTCRKRFAEQWTALHVGRNGPTGILALHREFQRDRKEYGAPADWVARAVDYCEKQGMKPPLPRERLWIVVQGYDVSPEEETAARATAAKSLPGAVIVARARIDQSYEPRILPTK